jgi:hypothetical protein
MKRAIPLLFLATAFAGCGNPYLASIRADLGRPETIADADRSVVIDANLLSAVAAAKDGVDNNGYRIALSQEADGQVIVFGENAEWLMGAKGIKRAIGVGVKPEGNKTRITIACYHEDTAKEVLKDVVYFYKKTAVGVGMNTVAPSGKTNLEEEQGKTPEPQSAMVATGPPNKPVAAPAIKEPPAIPVATPAIKEPPVIPVAAAAGADQGELLNIAVNDFRADGGSASDASVCSMLLRSAMVKTGAFNVVEKERMSAILEEQSTQQTGCTMQECAVKLGKLLNVKRFVVGNFGMLLGSYFLNVRVVDVESGRITFSESVKGTDADQLRIGLENLAVRLARGPI